MPQLKIFFWKWLFESDFWTKTFRCVTGSTVISAVLAEIGASQLL